MHKKRKGLVRLVARYVAGLSIDRNFIEENTPPGAEGVITNILDDIKSQVLETKQGLMICRLCGKGPFTKTGLYLHLLRRHGDDLVHLVMERVDERIRVARKTGRLDPE